MSTTGFTHNLSPLPQVTPPCVPSYHRSDLDKGGEKVAKQQVLLKMPAVEEAATFADVTTFYEVWEMMKVVDERIPMFWIMPKPETTAYVEIILFYERWLLILVL